MRSKSQAAPQLSGLLFVLLCDLVECDSNSLNRRLKHEYELREQGFLGRKLCVSFNFFLRNNLAVDEAELDSECAVRSLGLLEQELGGNDDVLSGKSDSSCAGESGLKTLYPCDFSCTLEQCVLNYEILYAVFTKILTELGVGLNGDTLVVNENTAGSVLQLSQRHMPASVRVRFY